MSDEPIKSGGLEMRQQSVDDRLTVDAYGDNGFRIMGRRFEGGVLLLETGVHPVSATDTAGLSEADLTPMLNHAPRPELVLLGTGTATDLPPKAIRTALADAGIGVDLMDTGAAARTFNVLVAEGRRVAALLLPVS
ncbi:Mth938-like domain-containing protein [Yunchengibacter salinarum]|uniref:Mth938-like domain-containing protein n=1 Tax=Yunchengibacter salinarum TaxID=3133399 RepID=UPI0035B607E1